MSVDEAPKPKITSDVREKNPGRVAAGKKLAAMNRARMSRTSNHHDTTEPVQHQVNDHDHDTTDWSSPMVLLTVIGVVSGLGCLYYTYKQDKRSDRTESQIERSWVEDPEGKARSRGSKISTRDVSQTSEEPRQSSPSSSSGGGNLKSFD